MARRDSADVIEASSAGLAPLGFVAEMTKAALARNGYATNGLDSKPMLPEDWDAADIVINSSGQPREDAFRSFAKVEDWNIEDPCGEDSETYQRRFEDIRHVAVLSAKLHRNGSKPQEFWR